MFRKIKPWCGFYRKVCNIWPLIQIVKWCIWIFSSWARISKCKRICTANLMIGPSFWIHLALFVWCSVSSIEVNSNTYRLKSWQSWKVVIPLPICVPVYNTCKFLIYTAYYTILFFECLKPFVIVFVTHLWPGSWI